ncbi:MAG: transcriptional repressor [Silicimonas sp.]|nr:transcriptional repressor [Silicimonas sp.]
MNSIGFDTHDHAHCIADGMTAADRQCQAAGVQMTPVRRRVLEILLEQHRAMGAYEILDVLRAEGLGSQPPVAYRSLDFLVSNGFAHRIERLNAFVACAHPGEDHTPAFLVCRVCDRVAEAQSDARKGRLGDAARAAGFRIERAVVEAVGLCPDCQKGRSE